MGEHLRRFWPWVRSHPWGSGAVVVFATAVVGAVAEALVQGAQSYAAPILRTIVFGWHPFPALAWFLVGPLCTLGLLWAWERFRWPPSRPDRSCEVRWRCIWEGTRIVELTPECPNPNCRSELRMVEGHDDYGPFTIFACPAPAPDCGFRLELRGGPATIRARAASDLEGQACGQSPMPMGRVRSRG
jgi:hypothetical protein